jgi:hypothetical protein
MAKIFHYAASIRGGWQGVAGYNVDDKQRLGVAYRFCGGWDNSIFNATRIITVSGG